MFSVSPSSSSIKYILIFEIKEFLLFSFFIKYVLILGELLLSSSSIKYILIFKIGGFIYFTILLLIYNWEDNFLLLI